MTQELARRGDGALAGGGRGGPGRALRPKLLPAHLLLGLCAPRYAVSSADQCLGRTRG